MRNLKRVSHFYFNKNFSSSTKSKIEVIGYKYWGVNTVKVIIIGTGKIDSKIVQTLSAENHDVTMNDKVMIFTKTTEVKKVEQLFDDRRKK